MRAWSRKIRVDIDFGYRAHVPAKLRIFCTFLSDHEGARTGLPHAAGSKLPRILVPCGVEINIISPATAQAAAVHHSNNDRRRILHRRHSLSLLSSSTNKNDTTKSNNNNSPFDLLRTNIFSPSHVIIDSDYTLAAAFAIIGIAILVTDYNVDGSLSLVGALGGTFITLLGVLFAIQARRIRFVFNEQYFEIKTVEQTTTTTAGSKGIVVLKDSGENFVVGGANRWAYTTFVNWKFFPSLDVPILVYFKEIQTKNDGQIHFFPAVANCKQIREQVSVQYIYIIYYYF